MNLNLEQIITPKSSNSFVFSPFSCGLQLKQDIENLFETKGQDLNENSSQLLNIDHRGFEVNYNIIDFPSPISIQQTQQQLAKFNNEIPTLELPLNIQKKLEKPKLKKEKKIKLEEVVEEVSIDLPKRNNNRVWQCVYSNTNDFSVAVYTKTRCDKPTEEVDEILYSSLKYEIKQKLVGDLNYPFLLSKIYVVESTTGEIVQKNNKGVLKGQIEVAITNPKENNQNNEISGILKVQFTDVSYHHKKCDFCWEIAYYTPNELNEPILKMRSAPFKVFARKPSQIASTTKKKRKREDQNEFDNFCLKLEELVQYTKKLKQEDQKIAINLVSSKISEFEKLFK